MLTQPPAWFFQPIVTTHQNGCLQENKFTQTKRVIGRRDDRLRAKRTPSQTKPTEPNREDTVRHVPRVPSHLFFNSNEALRPPYNIILDTNYFVNSVRHRVDISSALMDLLLAKCTPVVTDCVIAEFEKLSTKNRLALRVAKDPRFKQLACSHSGTYADDCIMSILSEHRIYLVGTGDADLKRRLRRLPGVPLVVVGRGKYYVERLPEVVS